VNAQVCLHTHTHTQHSPGDVCCVFSLSLPFACAALCSSVHSRPHALYVCVAQLTFTQENRKKPSQWSFQNNENVQHMNEISSEIGRWMDRERARGRKEDGQREEFKREKRELSYTREKFCV
jgi:hypothetical protein